MKRMATAMAWVVIGLVAFTASPSMAGGPGSHESHHPGASRPIDIGNRYCMAGSEGMGEAMMSGMMTGTMQRANPGTDAPACGMTEADCSANHSASCGHETIGERRADGCGA